MCGKINQLLAVLKEAAPSALAGLPSWANRQEAEGGEGGEREDGGEPSPAFSEHGLSEEHAGLGGPGSLARELRRKVFGLEQTVFSLEGKLKLADEARLQCGGAGGEDDDATASTFVAVYDGQGSASSGGKGEASGTNDADTGLCLGCVVLSRGFVHLASVSNFFYGEGSEMATPGGAIVSICLIAPWPLLDIDPNSKTSQ